jgi:hypothetical protein
LLIRNSGAAFRHSAIWLARCWLMISMAWVASPPVRFCGQMS